jgi:hypothetical protein
MDVTWVMPGQSIELHGGLGPMRSEGVTGVLRWTVKPAEDGTTVTQSYVVGGYLRQGGEHWAPIVDDVLQEQLTRLARLLDTGMPDAK